MRRCIIINLTFAFINVYISLLAFRLKPNSMI